MVVVVVVVVSSLLLQYKCSIDQYSRRTDSLHSETVFTFYQSTRFHIPGDGYRQHLRCKSPISSHRVMSNFRLAKYCYYYYYYQLQFSCHSVTSPYISSLCTALYRIKTGMNECAQICTPQIHLLICQFQRNTKQAWDCLTLTTGVTGVSDIRPTTSGHLVCVRHT
jgi:hypothetical protein